VITKTMITEILNDEFANLERANGDRFADSRAIFEEVTLGQDFVPFLTVPAYARYLHEDKSREPASPVA
jgi:malate synthase